MPIPGSQGSVQQALNNQALAVTRSSIVPINTGDVLIFEFAGGTTYIQLLSVSEPISGISEPSITITIIRIV